MTPERERKIIEVSGKRQLDLTVILENVHDPHNISAVVRTCDAVGVQAVYALYTDPQINTRKLRLGGRTSAGARKWVDTYLFTDLDKCVNAVRERCATLYATTITGGSQSIYKTDFTGSAALVFGNEHGGISDALMEHVDTHIYIPQHGMVQSLNISVACAVTLFEVLRQREEKGQYQNNPSQPASVREELLNDWMDRHKSGHKGRSAKRRGN